MVVVLRRPRHPAAPLWDGYHAGDGHSCQPIAHLDWHTIQRAADHIQSLVDVEDKAVRIHQDRTVTGVGFGGANGIFAGHDDADVMGITDIERPGAVWSRSPVRIVVDSAICLHNDIGDGVAGIRQLTRVDVQRSIVKAVRSGDFPILGGHVSMCIPEGPA